LAGRRVEEGLGRWVVREGGEGEMGTPASPAESMGCLPSIARELLVRAKEEAEAEAEAEAEIEAREMPWLVVSMVESTVT
jgi:hypothetical protein